MLSTKILLLAAASFIVVQIDGYLMKSEMGENMNKNQSTSKIPEKVRSEDISSSEEDSSGPLLGKRDTSDFLLPPLQHKSSEEDVSASEEVLETSPRPKPVQTQSLTSKKTLPPLLPLSLPPHLPSQASLPFLKLVSSQASFSEPQPTHTSILPPSTPSPQLNPQQPTTPKTVKKVTSNAAEAHPAGEEDYMVRATAEAIALFPGSGPVKARAVAIADKRHQGADAVAVAKGSWNAPNGAIFQLPMGNPGNLKLSMDGRSPKHQQKKDKYRVNLVKNYGADSRQHKYGTNHLYNPLANLYFPNHFNNYLQMEYSAPGFNPVLMIPSRQYPYGPLINDFNAQQNNPHINQHYPQMNQFHPIPYYLPQQQHNF